METDKNHAMKVLVVEDDPNARETAAEALRRDGWEVLLASEGVEGLGLAGAADVVLLDMDLPDVPGEQFLRAVRESGNWAPFVLAGCRRPGEISGEHLVDFVQKPWSIAELREAMGRAKSVAESIRVVGAATHRLRGFVERQAARA